MRYEIPVPIALKMSMNDRWHWGRKARVTSNLRLVAKFGARCIGAQQERVTVGLTWTVGDRRKRDAENPTPMLKALCDGLVDAGVIPDDTPAYVLKTMPEIVYVKGALQSFVFWVETFDQYGEDAA